MGKREKRRRGVGIRTNKGDGNGFVLGEGDLARKHNNKSFNVRVHEVRSRGCLSEQWRRLSSLTCRYSAKGQMVRA